MKTVTAALILAFLAALAGGRDGLAQQLAPSPASALIGEIENKAPPPAAPQAAATTANADEQYSAFRIEEERSRRTLILALIGAAIVSLVIVLGFLKQIGTTSAATIVSASGLVLVVYATVLVVMIAKADQQLTAAIGILGAIAGYLFGTATKGPTGKSKSEQE